MVSAMTFTDFLRGWHHEYAHRDREYPGEYRLGQALYNRLYYARPDLAAQIHGTSLDPFSIDGRIPAVLVWLSTHWEDESD